MRRALAAIPSAIPWLLVGLIVLMIAQAGVGLWREVTATPVQVRVFQCYANAGCQPYEPTEPGEE